MSDWIPCSERLPDKPNVYTVTDLNGKVVRYVFNDNESSRKYWRRCAKAWMPLPAPYQAESEEQNKIAYISFEEVKEILKKSIDETTNINEALEKTVQFIYSKGYEDGSKRLWISAWDNYCNHLKNRYEGD